MSFHVKRFWLHYFREWNVRSFIEGRKLKWQDTERFPVNIILRWENVKKVGSHVIRHTASAVENMSPGQG